MVNIGRQHLTILQLKASVCSPGIRLLLYRTFVRPSFEYGLGMIKAWTLYTKPNEDPMEELRELHRNGLRWIATTTHSAQTCIRRN